jgi:pyruvate kinase
MRPTRTKIVATVGPASGSPETIQQMVSAGVDVFRLNLSHGDHQTHRRYVEAVRQAAAQADAPVAVMADLQGPRLRTGTLRGHKPVVLREGSDVVLRAGDFEGDGRSIAVNYRGLAADVKPGDRVLLSDGLIELSVTATDGTEARCRVEVGGELGERKGINLPGVGLGITSPTEKDLDDLRFALECGVDLVALSFVRTADDVARLKQAMEAGGRPGQDDPGVPVIAKVEKPEAVENLEEILGVADGVMVARGDLGIEMPTEAVPAVQKTIIRAANRLGVPAITATQMLESMVHSPRPTRAEASDVANAILDGTDAVMLSAETSVGSYPVEAVQMMDRIARKTEELQAETAGEDLEGPGAPQQQALASAACMIARRLKAAGIVPFTLTGSTARYVSQRRPRVPVYALTPNERTYRRLALVWGVRGVMLDMFESTDEMIERGRKRLLELGLASPGDVMVYVAGASTRTPGGTDMLKIERF